MNISPYQAALPPSERPAREAALAQFAAAGFPGPALEHWHYSDFTGLSELSFAANGAEATPPWLLDATQPLPLGDSASASAQPRFAFDALNTALAAQGVTATLASSTLPYLLVQPVPSPGAMSHWRHTLQLAANTQATLVLWDGARADPDAEGADSLATSLLQLELAAGSQLTLIRLQNAPRYATQATHLSATVARDAQLKLFSLDLGGRRARFEPHVVLAEPGATLHYAGLTAIAGKSHADTQLRVQHAAPHGMSQVEARLIAADKARAICNPQIVVAPGAAKTDSETRCHSLLLSGKAEIDAKPELMIDADDVKCAHGATFGQLDADAAFYLRSRGLSAAEAQGLLTLAFADSVLSQLPLPLLRDWATAQVQSLLNRATP